MNGLLTFLSLALCVGIVALMPVEGATAVLLCVVLTALVGFIVSRAGTDKLFLMRLFISGVLIRMLLGAIIYFFNLQDFFGGDATTYDFFGDCLLRLWQGERYYQTVLDRFAGESGGGGWGMLYMVAAVYKIIGRNMLAIQFVNSILGAATAVVIYLCALHIFNNSKVARIAGLFAAFYPSLVLWSSQGLKDGPIVFTLALSMLATLKLGEKFSAKYLLTLILALFALLSLRFYVFYMMVTAVAGAFLIGMRPLTAQSFVRQFVIIVALGLAMTYLGVSRYATTQFKSFGNMDAVQRTRSDLSQSAASGFGKDLDVSTTEGALSAIPMGLLYLLFAPFPWQLASLRQSITLPEMVIWWLSFPLLILGLWFSIKYRLRRVSPILIFTTMLTIAYSLFQGNIGTAYRQRSQLLVFYFIFVAVGFVLFQERREEQRRQESMARQELAEKQAAARARRSKPGYAWANGLHEKEEKAE